jgi:stress-induced morphogen
MPARRIWHLVPDRAGPYICIDEMTGARKMPIQASEIEDLIRATFPEARITITDLAGDGNHYAAEVIDASFKGKNRVQQQRAVYAALKGKMDGAHGELHALALTTKAPD